MRTIPSPAPRRTSVLLGVVLTALVTLVAGVVWALSPGSNADPDRARAAAPSTTGAAQPAAPATPTRSASPGTSGSPGSLQPAPYEEVTPRPAVPLSATADFGTGLTLRIVEVEAVRSEARSPGEVSAPAVRLTMRARNASDRPIAVDGLAVTLEHGAARTPAVGVTEPGGAPFTGVLEPGATARGVYVFNVPPGERDLVRVTTSYTGAAPTLVLAGSLA
ncbi:hypothetical protein [Nocardioides lijunqiniae]|uniref:hypothetical protein n=1 Tax=Nocardioides lijunqiniae TaxID=2760832 RepID=UPI00187839EF|nr:hypothetical protein [Nocardioides lijunqiniae]